MVPGIESGSSEAWSVHSLHVKSAFALYFPAGHIVHPLPEVELSYPSSHLMQTALSEKPRALNCSPCPCPEAIQCVYFYVSHKDERKIQ